MEQRDALLPPRRHDPEQRGRVTVEPEKAARFTEWRTEQYRIIIPDVRDTYEEAQRQSRRVFRLLRALGQWRATEGYRMEMELMRFWLFLPLDPTEVDAAQRKIERGLISTAMQQLEELRNRHGRSARSNADVEMLDYGEEQRERPRAAAANVGSQ